MPGLDPGIHDFAGDSEVVERQEKTWMAGSSPAMTPERSGGKHRRKSQANKAACEVPLP
jgi:hypothetical protein